MMNIHYFQHVPFEGLGSIKKWVLNRKYKLTCTRFYKEELFPDLDQIDFLIIMGGPMGVYQYDQYSWLLKEKRCIEKAINADKTVLGICLGAQIIAEVLGSRVYRSPVSEIGWFPVQWIKEENGLLPLGLVKESTKAFHWHNDTFDLPGGSKRLAKSQACKNQAFVYQNRVFGLQFHLEVTKPGVKELISACSHEMVEGPFVQTPERILEKDAEFQQANSCMDAILDELEVIRKA